MDERKEPITPPTQEKAYTSLTEEVRPAPTHGAVRLGRWIHRNKGVTDTNPLGYVAYQFVRSAVASVPYGLSMAATWLGFQKLHELGGRMEEGAKAAGKSGEFGKRLKQFTAPGPVRLAAMIGTSFSFYRGASKIGKWVNESLFNKDDSEDVTIRKVQELPKAVWGKIGEVAPAEINSTPVAAVVLGFLLSAFKAPPELATALKSCKGKGMGHFWKEVIANPKTKFVEQAALATAGYSLFFELGDRRFKDKQVSRGLWGGDAHSIGSGSKSNPSLLDENEAEQSQDVQANGRTHDRLSWLTSEPSAVRFALRRVVPTAIGVTAYTALKFRGAPLVLGAFPEVNKAGEVAFSKISQIPKNAWREGAATSLFFMIPAVTDKYVKWYDNFVNGLEEKLSGKQQMELPAATKQAIAQNHQQLAQDLEGREQVRH